MDSRTRKKILIVDDEDMNRELLRRIFEGSYEIIMAKDGKEALDNIKWYKDSLAVILLDLIMPVMNGYQVLQVLNTDNIPNNIPIVLISANTDVRITLSCYSLGAIDIIGKPFIPEMVRRRVENVIKLYRRSEHLELQLAELKEDIIEKEKKLDGFYENFLAAVGNIVEFRNPETGHHIKNVKNLTRIIATTYMNLYPEDNITQEWVDLVVQFSAIHDIGKIAISDKVLLKPGKLNSEELEIMKGHTTKGCDILDEMESFYDSENYKLAYDIVRYHHERYDGSGYPDGLVGDEIPLSAQLVAVADAYDNLINDRVNKKAHHTSKAYDMIVTGRCGAFSPKIIKCFKQAAKVIEYYLENQ